MPDDVIDQLWNPPAPLYTTMRAAAIAVPAVPAGMTEELFDTTCQGVMAAAAPTLAGLTELTHGGAAKRTLELLRDGSAEQVKSALDHLDSSPLVGISKAEIYTVARYANGEFSQDEYTKQFRSIPQLASIKQEVGAYVKASAAYCVHLLEKDLTPEQRAELATSAAASRSAEAHRPADAGWYAAMQAERPVNPIAEGDDHTASLLSGQRLFNLLDDLRPDTSAERRGIVRTEIIDALNTHGINRDNGGIDITYRGHHNLTLVNLIARYREKPIFIALCDAIGRNGSFAGTGINDNQAIKTIIKDTAIDIGHIPTMLAFKADGYDFNAQSDSSGYTKLHHAARQGNPDMAVALLIVGALPIENNERQTPTEVAVAHNHHNTAIAIHAEINRRDAAGNTRLHAASHGMSARRVAIFLRAGADPTITNHQGRPPILVLNTAAANFDEVQDLLLNKVNQQDEHGNTQLHKAVAAQDVARVSALLTAGANQLIPNLHGQMPGTALDRRTAAGDLIYEHLQQYINFRQDQEGHTQLHLAVRQNDTAKVASLLKAGADFMIENNHRKTPMELIDMQAPNAALLKSTFQQYLDIKNHHGNTRLHHAAMNGDNAVVEKLLRAGASQWIENNEGAVPLYSAAQYGQQQTLALLMLADREKMVSSDILAKVQKAAYAGHVQAVQTFSTVFQLNLKNPDIYHLAFKMAENGHTNALQTLKDGGLNLDTIRGTGFPLLHQAVSSNEAKMKTPALLDAGANIEALDSNGNTALHIGALYGSARSVNALLSKGASLSAKDRDGNTPLHLAAQKSNGGMVKRLLEAGANLNITNNAGKTPIQLVTHEATRKGFPLSEHHKAAANLIKPPIRKRAAPQEEEAMAIPEGEWVRQIQSQPPQQRAAAAASYSGIEQARPAAASWSQREQQRAPYATLPPNFNSR